MMDDGDAEDAVCQGWVQYPWHRSLFMKQMVIIGEGGQHGHRKVPFHVNKESMYTHVGVRRITHQK